MDKRKLVLVVEDDRGLAEMTAALIEYAGYRPVIAMDGKEALETLARTSPSLIILDIMMPQLNGIQVMEHISCNSEYRKVPVIAYSALKDEKIKEKLFALGAVEYIEKGRGIDTIIGTIKQYLE